MKTSIICVLLFLRAAWSFQICGTDPLKNFTVVETSINGNVSNILWLQQRNVFVLTDTENAYHSQDGGMTWDQVSPDFQTPTRGFLQMYSNSNSMTAYFVTDPKLGFNSSVWIYSVIHDSYEQQLPRLAYLQPHTAYTELAVALTTQNALYITGDQFQTVTFVDSNVLYGYWDAMSYYYLTTDNNLKVVQAGSPPTLVSAYVHWLAGADYNLFITKITQGGEVLLLCNTESGWQKVNFPVALKENMFSIVDVSVGSIIMVVINEKDNSRGDLYMSDDADLTFVEVLSDVVVQPDGLADVRLLGELGVLLANQYVSDSDIQTLISFDNGGKWQPLTPPDGCAKEGCGVQLHMGPLHTRSSAVGFVLATGNVGTALNASVDGTSTFFSRTIGVQWSAVSLSSTTYEFTDHGALMVVADNVNPTYTIKYSWNEALSFEECQFSDSLATVSGIAAGPSAASQVFLLYGSRADMTNTLVYLDFSGLHQRECNNSDYESWSVLGENCLLGQKLTYTRRKQTSECYNPVYYEPVQRASMCACTQDDYECDYCYTEQDGICVLACPPTPINTTCQGNYTVSKGYRLVPGTHCLLQDGLDLTPSVVACDSGNSNGGTGSSNVVVIAVVTVVVVVALALGVVFAWRNPRTRRWVGDRVRYGRYKLLGDRGNADGSLLGGGGLYDEDWDMDSDAPILNDDAIIQLSEGTSS